MEAAVQESVMEAVVQEWCRVSVFWYVTAPQCLI